MIRMHRTRTSVLGLASMFSLMGSVVCGGTPDQLLRGEAPVLFTAAEGEDANATVLADGVSAVRGDEIWLWVPAITAGNVDLGTAGSFYRIWDSGTEAGPDGNDDDDNGMRGMAFDHVAGDKFLISYEDTTTTGFAAPFDAILDGDLMELTVLSLTNGAINANPGGFSWSRLFSECANGTAGCIGTGDINALSVPGDGFVYFGSGTTQDINTDVPGVLSVSANTVVKADISGTSPVNVGPDKFFEAGVVGCPVIFCPSIGNGQLRGFDLLANGEITFGTSGDYRNTTFSGPIDMADNPTAESLSTGVVNVCLKADICSVPEYNNNSLPNDYLRRTAEVLYSGSLFFQTPNVGDSEILDHDILDTLEQGQVLIALLGADSDAGMALAPFFPAGPDPICGDGVVEGAEQCDDMGESVSCNADCTFSSCGDGTLNMTDGEECDDGNHDNGDTCNADCTLPGAATVPAIDKVGLILLFAGMIIVVSRRRLQLN